MLLLYPFDSGVVFSECPVTIVDVKFRLQSPCFCNSNCRVSHCCCNIGFGELERERKGNSSKGGVVLLRCLGAGGSVGMSDPQGSVVRFKLKSQLLRFFGTQATKPAAKEGLDNACIFDCTTLVVLISVWGVV